MNIIQRGEVAGVLCLIAFVINFIAMFVFGVGKSLRGDVVSLVIYLVVCITYTIFLISVNEIVKSVGNSIFTRRMRQFFWAVVISCFFVSPLLIPILLPDLFEEIMVLVFILITSILGIMSIRVAPFFDKFENDQNNYGRKTAKWLKISGWLQATVILSIVGGALSLVADFYMWKLVKQERLNMEKK